MDKKPKRKLPSAAFVVTFLTGTTFLIFSGAESISGIVQGRSDFSIGGLIEIFTFSLPFFILSYFLWFRPKTGAILLIITGLVFAWWMHNDFRPGKIKWIIMFIIVILPIMLGIFTLIREMMVKKTETVNSGLPEQGS